MPVPWGGGCLGRPKFPLKERIPEARDRATTLRQLRDLRDFIKRLCKASLLKRESNRIFWFNVDQYDIKDLVIKKIIPEADSCSWAELIARGKPQPAEVFCSHFWGESFRDFMCAIESHALEKRRQPDTGYWVCVYADDQWNLSLKSSLKDSPFYQALEKSHETLVMLDRKGIVRTRAWCIYEWSLTLDLEHQMRVGTSLGLVGSALVSSGPFIEYMHGLQTSQACATEKEDRRRILNYIAGLPEMAGLEKSTSTDGKMTIGLMDMPDYEAKLLDDHARRFADLDDKIRQKALQTVRHDSGDLEACAKEVNEPWRRAVSLAQLRSLAERVKTECVKWGASDIQRACGFKVEYGNGDTLNWDNVDVTAVKWQLIKPDTKDGKSYMEHIPGGKPLVGEYRVSYVTKMKFKNFIKSIEWFAEARRLPDTTGFWVDQLASKKKQDQDDEGLKSSIEHCTGFVCICDKDTIQDFVRTGFVLYEQFQAVSRGKAIDYACPTGALATTRPFADGHWEFCQFCPVIASELVKISIRKARFKKSEDESAAAKEIGHVDGHGFTTFHNRIRSKAAGPVMREAAYEGESGKIDAVLRSCSGLKLNDRTLQGSCGETALHVAASCGQLDMMKHLLEERAALDAEDSDGETPLHYAALAGKTDSVKILLEWMAQSTESFFSERPLQVAQQEPAYFLGNGDDIRKSYEDVMELLEEHPTQLPTSISRSRSIVLPHVANSDPVCGHTVSALVRRELNPLKEQLDELKCHTHSTARQLSELRKSHNDVQSMDEQLKVLKNYVASVGLVAMCLLAVVTYKRSSYQA